MSLSGLPFIHSDAGGFAQGTKDEELYTRWLQMACFSPILRPHGSDIPSEPVYFSDTTQQIVRDFIKLRYSLLPYIYTLTYLASIEGEPIVRPLFYEFPDDTTTYSVGDEYMFGDNILVAPVIEQGQQNRNVYLPEGTAWYGFWHNIKYDGGQWIELETESETIPVFVKAGSFIPFSQTVQTTDNYTTEQLTIRYYPGDSATIDQGLIYNDDGHTFLAHGTKNGYEILNFSAMPDDKTYSFIFESRNYELPLDYEKREIKLEIIGQDVAGNGTDMLTTRFTWKVHSTKRLIVNKNQKQE